MANSSLTDKQYSVSIYFDKEGVPHLGNVQGFYAVDSNCYDIIPVVSSVKLEIGKALNIHLKARTKVTNGSRQQSSQAL